MDIRLRLLLAFSPLLVLLLGTAIALPFIQRESRGLLARQVAATDALSDVQSLQLSIFHEHDAVIHIVEGEGDEGHARLAEARRQTAALFAHRAADGHAPIPQDDQLQALYRELSARHDTAIAIFEGGDQVAAEEAIHNPDTDALIDSILSLGAAAAAASRADLDAATLALQESVQFALLRAALSTVVGITATLILSWVLVGQVIRPLNRLATDAECYAAGDATGQLSPGGNTAQVRRLREAFQRLLDANRARQERVRDALAELEARVAREERLRDTVEALSVPVVPLREDMLLLPLVGHFDQRRAAQLTQALLAAIRGSRARAVVIDLTGLAALSDETAALLRETATAARLLGSRVILVGVRAEQAATLAAADLGASGVTTARDIPSVLAADMPLRRA